MSIIVFIIILTALVFVHELGHFIAAKRAGVRVDEFGIGFPPRIFKKKIGETIYSLNLFPIGGFVKIFGENPDDESREGKDAKRSLTHKARPVQALVLSAGIIFNIIFAWILISASLMIGVPFSSQDSRYGARVEDPAVIMHVLPESPAANAGLKDGDRLLALYSGSECLDDLSVAGAQKFISSHNELVLGYLRNKEIRTVPVETKEGIVPGRRAIGISMDSVGMLKLPIHEALYASVFVTADMTAGTAVGITHFFKNIIVGHADLSGIAGPVGLVSIVRDNAALGFVNLLSLTAIISINLAVINLLPLPALDGGRLFFLLIEAIKRSPIKPEVVNVINGIGFIALMILMLFITFHDVMNIVRG